MKKKWSPDESSLFAFISVLVGALVLFGIQMANKVQCDGAVTDSQSLQCTAVWTRSLYVATVGVVMSTLVLGAATYKVAVRTANLVNVTENQEKLLEAQEGRNTAILGLRQLSYRDALEQPSDDWVYFEVWNEGLRPTALRELFLRYTGPGEFQEFRDLFVCTFDWETQLAAHVAPEAPPAFRWRGHVLEPGALLFLKARSHGAITLGPKPELCIVPVLGKPVTIELKRPSEVPPQTGRPP